MSGNSTQSMESTTTKAGKVKSNGCESDDLALSSSSGHTSMTDSTEAIAQLAPETGPYTGPAPGSDYFLRIDRANSTDAEIDAAHERQSLAIRQHFERLAGVTQEQSIRNIENYLASIKPTVSAASDETVPPPAIRYSQVPPTPVVDGAKTDVPAHVSSSDARNESVPPELSKRPASQATTSTRPRPPMGLLGILRNAMIVMLLYRTFKAMDFAADLMQAMLGSSWAGSLMSLLVTSVALPLVCAFAIWWVTDKKW
ncbi:hypothetical protein LTR10_009532 [Elasticomyces elasticus]|uniref:Uncharacterized protein n=1 Tax=Elasticomyces elasticus TaxID=574655 RepID=A0AAN7VNS7_9PEZI|nr:hypothetical protein LTR10_009532 [Elasticomyces elasticus]KAK4971372.1 hypothetical protein LTR42_007099 [Elasticomyces elasticus]KAK5695466.1 hypothetical protein LTR97_008974 [Elasticomyces elasticus]